MSTLVTRKVELTRETVLRSIDWNSISETVAAAFRMNEDEHACFADKQIAQLIAAIPFIAGCKDPERTAVAHLGTYLMSNRAPKRYFNARAADSAGILNRLEMIGNFVGGDEKLIRRGMNLIALIMLEDYARDVEEDSELGKYNPVAAGEFDYQSERDRLIAEIEAVPSSEMDAIIDLSIVPLQYWVCCS